MNTLFRCRCDQVLSAFLDIAHKRELQALDLERGSEIARLRRERRALRRRVKYLEQEALTRSEAAVSLCERLQAQVRELMEAADRNPDQEEEEFVQV